VGRKLYPVGKASASRSAVPHGRERVLSRSARHPDPPAPPDTLDPRGVELHMELWGLPVALLWEDWQADDVVRLVELHLLRERGEAKGWIYSGIANLRTTLFLTPKALRAAGVRLEGTPSDLPHGGGDAGDDDELDVSDEQFEAEVAELRARSEL
jgi:hypothetical protein